MSNGRNIGENIGGISKLFVALAAEVGVVSSALSSGQLAKFEAVPFTPETAFRQLKQQTSGAGLFYEEQIECLVPKDRPEVQAMIRKYGFRRLMCLLRDFNGNTYLLGSKEFPLSWQASFVSGQKTADYQHHRIELSGVLPDGLYDYPGSLPGDVTGEPSGMLQFKETQFTESQFK